MTRTNLLSNQQLKPSDFPKAFGAFSNTADTESGRNQEVQVKRQEKRRPESGTAGVVGLTAVIAKAYLSRHRIPARAVPDVIRQVHNALVELQSETRSLKLPTATRPAVPVHKSVTPSYLICLEDGTKLKALTRYLKRRYGLTPDAYRKRWGLPSDYPMVAPKSISKYKLRPQSYDHSLAMMRQGHPADRPPDESYVASGQGQ